jgi:hypothetical protein
MGAPMDGAKSVMTRWKRQGHTLIIHSVMATSDSGAKAIADWLRYYKIPYDSVTATKPQADWYIDDKGYQHTDWSSTLAFITSQMLSERKVSAKKKAVIKIYE